jgi:tetratricopeptide (TPR) repeat protein
MLGLSRAVISGLVEARFVAPQLGRRGEYRFSFQDLVVMRTAQGLTSAHVPVRRISRALKRLREQLPYELPLTGLRISAIGNRVVVREGSTQWQADSGQYLLDFEVAPASGRVSFLANPPQPVTRSAEDWFNQGCELEAHAAVGGACAAYERAIEADACHVGAYTNLGRLLQERGEMDKAEAVYRRALQHCGDEALLHFNFGVLLEDLGRRDEAIAAYKAALNIHQEFADCHYNIALLYEAAGKTREAVRHLSAYRKLQAAT